MDKDNLNQYGINPPDGSNWNDVMDFIKSQGMFRIIHISKLYLSHFLKKRMESWEKFTNCNLSLQYLILISFNSNSEK